MDTTVVGESVNALLPQEEWTALHLAAACNNALLVQSLLNQGANPSFQRQTRLLANPTPLHVASRFGAVDVIAPLISAGANVNAVDNQGFAALHFAVANGHISAVRLLLDAGALCLTTSHGGLSPLQVAECTHHSEIISLLRSHSTNERNPLHPKFKQWLESIGAGGSFEAFVNAGYDIGFIAEHGLTDEDLECVGIDPRRLGIRRKLRALHNIHEFVTLPDTNDDSQSEESSSDSEQSDDSGGEASDES